MPGSESEKFSEVLSIKSAFLALFIAFPYMKESMKENSGNPTRDGEPKKSEGHASILREHAAKNTGEKASLRASSETEDVPTNAAAIPLHTWLRLAGILMATLAVSSIACWFLGRPAILNPFVSLLTFVAAPFAFVMGIAAKQK